MALLKHRKITRGDYNSALKDSNTEYTVVEANGDLTRYIGDKLVLAAEFANSKARANHTGSQPASTISDFAATVRASVLTGLSTSSAAVVSATDSILSGIGKLQKQISDLISTVNTKANLASPTFTGSPKAPNPGSNSNDTTIATTSFVVDKMGAGGGGDMLKSVYDTNNSGSVDNADKVGGFTVGVNVPSNAVFTDTIYLHPTIAGAKHLPAGGTQNLALLNNGISGEGQWVSITKSLVGLNNADNTSDIDKPVSTATSNYIDSILGNILGVLGDINGGNNGGGPSTPPGDIGSQYSGPYTSSPRVNVYYESNKTYEGLTFTPDNTENGGACLEMNNMTNVTIKNCYFKGATNKPAIYMYQCSNITIENCVFEDCFAGVWFDKCGNNLVVLNCEQLNVLSYMTTYDSGNWNELGQFVMFNECVGSGIVVKNNSVENQPGVGFPEDLINFYKSKGTSGSPILIENNYLRGGSFAGSGVGIMVGDNHGEHILVKNNILVSTGGSGIGVAGGKYITVEDNLVFGYVPESWFNPYFATNYGNDGGQSPSDIIFRNNSGLFINKNGGTNTTYLINNNISSAVTLEGNITDNTLTRAILPLNILNVAVPKSTGLWFHKTHPYNRTEFDMDVNFISGTTMSAPSFKSDIKAIRVPEGVTSLASNALGGTSSTNNIVSIILPSSLQSIGDNGLSNNSELVSIVANSAIPPTVGTNGLSGLGKLTLIFIHYENLLAYASASGWSAHVSKFTPM